MTATHIYQIRRQLRTRICALAAHVERNANLAYCTPYKERAIEYRKSAQVVAVEAFEVAQRLSRAEADAEARAAPGTKAGRAAAEARAMRTDQLAESRDFRRAR